jgi:serine/threonine-protein kinase
VGLENQPLFGLSSGVVLSAWDSVTGTTVAVKVLSPLLADRPEVLRRFLREIRALQELEHPGVVKILDVGEQGVNPYYAMEFLDGRDLGDLIRAESPLPLSRAGPICRQLFETLAHVHGKGIVHRDVKLPNILLLVGDRVKLLDFGLAHVPEASTMTADGEVLGTLRYMSPEQMDGRPLGPASDVFSAALVAYELLTRAMPYPELGKVLNTAAPRIPLTERRPDAPPELSELLLAMLDPDPERRLIDWGRIVDLWSAGMGDRCASEVTGGSSA